MGFVEFVVFYMAASGGGAGRQVLELRRKGRLQVAEFGPHYGLVYTLGSVLKRQSADRLLMRAEKPTKLRRCINTG